jgi:hypothetical protein
MPNETWGFRRIPKAPGDFLFLQYRAGFPFHFRPREHTVRRQNLLDCMLRARLKVGLSRPSVFVFQKVTVLIVQVRIRYKFSKVVNG